MATHWGQDTELADSERWGDRRGGQPSRIYISATNQQLKKENEEQGSKIRLRGGGETLCQAQETGVPWGMGTE